MKNILIAFVVTMLVLPAACTWVKPTARGDMVRVAAMSQVATCEKIGETKTSVMAKVGFIDRDKAKVEEEVATLARTSAADMGGDAIVPLGEAMDGERSFAVYRCDKP